MRVLVTGSSGFIGKEVAVSLAVRGHGLIAFDRPDHDITDADDLALTVRGYGADAIINLAGALGTPELFGHEDRAIKTNILGAVNAYNVAANYGIPVVQIGTGHKGQPNPYAITKGAAEDIGLARAKFLGEKISVVRAYHAYGPGQAVGPPHGKASVHKFFPTFACRALDGLPLEVCGAGTQLIDPVHVTDVAEVLVDALEGPYGKVFEAGNGAGIPVMQVAWDIANAVQEAQPYGTVRINMAASRMGEPVGANVVASEPQCKNPWPYLVDETVGWYRSWLSTVSSAL